MGGGSSDMGLLDGLRRRRGGRQARLPQLQQLQLHAPGRVPVGVGVNALRATLGIRPLPVPVAGAVRGVLHCTGACVRVCVFTCWWACLPACVRVWPCKGALLRTFAFAAALADTDLKNCWSVDLVGRDGCAALPCWCPLWCLTRCISAFLHNHTQGGGHRCSSLKREVGGCSCPGVHTLISAAMFGTAPHHLRAGAAARPPVSSSMCVHVSAGPLEKPVFSGTAVAVRPPLLPHAPAAAAAPAPAQAPGRGGGALPPFQHPAPRGAAEEAAGSAGVLGPRPLAQQEAQTQAQVALQQEGCGEGVGEEASDAQAAMLSRCEQQAGRAGARRGMQGWLLWAECALCVLLNVCPVCAFEFVPMFACVAALVCVCTPGSNAHTCVKAATQARSQVIYM